MRGALHHQPSGGRGGRFRLVPADAPVGVHGVRIANPTGISNLWLMMVDDLASVAQTKPNAIPAQAQALTVPVGVETELAPVAVLASSATWATAGVTVVGGGRGDPAAIQLVRVRHWAAG